MKNPPFDSLVWGSLRLAPIIYQLWVQSKWEKGNTKRKGS